MIIRNDETADVTVTGVAGTMRLHLVRPNLPGRFPGVVVFSEIYQVTDPIRRLAAMVAGQGYLVAVPEVYHEYEPPGTVLRYDTPGTERGNALKFTKPVAAYDADARAALAFLREHACCTGRLGTLGVCLGGHLAYRAALNQGVSAAACFYATDIHSSTLGAGRADDSLARMDELQAEALFVWGRQDPHVPFAGRQAIRERLEAVGARYSWHEVNAAHAFLRDEGPRYDPALFRQSLDWVLALFQRALGGTYGMTWSIVAHDPETGAFAVAVTTCAFAVGASCPFVQAGVGAVSTQSITNRYLGPAVLAGLARGLAPVAAIEGALVGDDGKHLRQVHAVDREGRSAAWTGQHCVAWCGSASAPGVSVAGNMLAGPAVVGDTLATYGAGAAATLPERLMDALDAGQRAGGDRRGRQSAAMLVTTTEDFPDLNLRVDDHADPLAQLRRLLGLWRSEALPRLKTAPSRRQPSGLTDMDAIEAGWRARGLTLSFTR